MKKVTAIVGSPRKRGMTFAAARQFLDNLEPFGDVQGEIVFLSDYNLGTCTGCKSCFGRGEEHCPLKDDRDLLIEKMMASDGIIFASPNYSFHVSALMKKFLDRLAFLFHRPCFHGKTYTSIVMQGIHRGGNVVGYLDFVGRGLGFNVVAGSSIASLEPMAQKDQRKMDRTLARQSERFREQLLKPAYPEPSIFKLLSFRMRRTRVHLKHVDNHRDHSYFRDRGWFESDYFYPVELGSMKKAVASTFDLVAALLYKH